MAGLPNSSKALQQWQHLFEEKGVSRTEQARQHLQQMLRLGLPTRKHEDWKYTPLEGLTHSQFIQQCATISAAQRDALALQIDAVRLVFVDGRFMPELSDSTQNSGFDVSVRDERQTLAAPVHPEVFLHLTESLAQCVTYIQVRRNQRPTRPLLLMHITQGVDSDELNTAHYRHHLALAEGAEATVIEHYVSLTAAKHFTGARLTMNVADNAQLRHIKLAFENASSYHFAHNDLLLATDASAFSHSFLLGAAVLRHHSSSQLNGENATLRLNSLAMPVKNEVCDTRTWLEHNKGYCNSRQLHKTIVSDKGRAVFNGLINVAQHAIKTDGQMTNNNLLLGKLAEVDTKPQLEIYADDVKCSHGATIGRIDDEQMFYLQSRGIRQQEARHMILYAFAAELTEAIHDSALKQQVLARIGQRLPGAGMTFPVEKVRADFPILQREVNGLPLAYLDSAASAQKPNQVIDAESAFYRHGYAAVHRGIHTLSAQATESMENVRKQASRFINARSAEELVFVRGTTEGINLVANSWGTENIRAGDNIIISEMEHHANIVPWQMLCERKGAELRVIPLHPDGTLRLETLAALFDDRTRLLAITHVSNVLGTENPLPDMIALARQHGAKVLVDGAQAVMHHAVDVQALDCDFYVFSGHKLYGPTGIGILYVKEALLQEMPPWEGGGSMISTVSLTQGTTWAKAPWRFEAGTPNTGGIIGLGAAIDYVTSLGLDKIGDYEQMLMRYALEQLAQVPDITLYGPAQRLGVITFNLGKHHAYDVGSFLDNYGIAVRTGHHCAMPLMAWYGVPAMCRASLAMYNTHEEVDRLVAGLTRIHRLLG